MTNIEKIDFAKGYKTLAGVVLLFAPMINERIGVNVTPELLNALGSSLGTLISAFLIVFGVCMKILRK